MLEMLFPIDTTANDRNNWLKPILTGENTRVLIILTTTV